MSNTSESGPNSPPTIGSRGSPTSAPIQEENEDPSYGAANRANINDLPLFSSPSMPNISLGRPHLSNAHVAAANHFVRKTFKFLLAKPNLPSNEKTLSFQALLSTLRAPSQPLVGGPQPHVPAPYLIPQLELTEVQAQAATAHLNHIQALSAVAAASSGISVPGIYGQPITDAQVAQARLHKQGHRPLGRTQSAPLPLGHPMLTGTAISIAQTHYENSEVSSSSTE